MSISQTKSFGAGSPQGNTPPPRPMTHSRWAKRKSQEPGNSGRCALRTPSASSCGLRSSIVVGWWSIVGDMASRITALVRCAANPSNLSTISSSSVRTQARSGSRPFSVMGGYAFFMVANQEEVGSQVASMCLRPPGSSNGMDHLESP
jgi:hypothetical protein